jgi:hypothetical protein
MKSSLAPFLPNKAKELGYFAYQHEHMGVVANSAQLGAKITAFIYFILTKREKRCLTPFLISYSKWVSLLLSA